MQIGAAPSLRVAEVMVQQCPIFTHDTCKARAWLRLHCIYPCLLHKRMMKGFFVHSIPLGTDAEMQSAARVRFEPLQQSPRCLISGMSRPPLFRLASDAPQHVNSLEAVSR